MPYAPSLSVPLPEPSRNDLAECRALLRGGSRSFYAASHLLPRGFAEPASALYAFCRLADDAVDQGGDSAAALDLLQRRLDAVYAGSPVDCAADRALAEVVARYELPKALLEALFEGFHWDATGRGYDGLSELLDYAARVAGTVGAMMAVLMGVRAPDMLARAADLGVAMQLTNIARDVGEDARDGRLYLPANWLREAGLDPQDFLASPRYSPALGSVVRRLLEVAEQLYRRADSGIARLPRACRPAMYAARLLYAEIGREVERRQLDSVSQRAVVSAPRKLAVLSRLAGLALLSDRQLSAPPLAETRFLVDAAARAAAPAPADELGPVRARLARIERKYVWVLELFDDLDRRERAGQGAAPLVNEPVARA